MTDDVKTAEPTAPPELPVDPMAKARASKAAKALAKAEAELAAAVEGKGSQANGQPVVSTFRGRAANPFMGQLVEVKVTPWGHAEVSTGGEDGFERFAAGAVTSIPEQSARSLFNKRWVTPTDPSYEAKWLDLNRRELLAAMQAKARTESKMRNGVAQGEEWRSALDGGELAFNPTERDLKSVGVA